MTGSVWERPETVAGFVDSDPNPVLMRFAERLAGGRSLNILDIGCGAGRNAVPLAMSGHRVTGVDSSQPMLAAARRRAKDARLVDAVFWGGRMDRLEFADGQFDLVIAHGIWNLAATDQEWTTAVSEAARVAKPGAALFVFTFSRHTLGAAVAPVPGQRHVFTRFSGGPQVFVTEAELTAELRSAGFEPEGNRPLTEYNRPAFLPPLGVSPRPVLWEGVFLKKSSSCLLQDKQDRRPWG